MNTDEDSQSLPLVPRQFPKISTCASRFRLVVDDVEIVVGTTLDVVILGSNPRVSKIWYSKPFDGGPDPTPDCYSADGIVPDSSINKPFHVNCAGCSNNILGSKLTPNGTKNKICSDVRYLAVLPTADPTKVYRLAVTMASNNRLCEYMNELTNFGLIIEKIVTKLGFDDNQKSVMLSFKQKSFVSEAALNAVSEICASDEVMTATRQKIGTPRPVASAPDMELAAPTPKNNAAVKLVEDDTPPAGALISMESTLNALFSND